MSKIDWKRKLSSRKFWMAVIGFVTATMTASGASDNTIAQTTSVIMAGAILIAYIIAEGFTDGKAVNDGAYEVTEDEYKALLEMRKEGR